MSHHQYRKKCHSDEDYVKAKEASCKCCDDKVLILKKLDLVPLVWNEANSAVTVQRNSLVASQFFFGCVNPTADTDPTNVFRELNVNFNRGIISVLQRRNVILVFVPSCPEGTVLRYGYFTSGGFNVISSASAFFENNQDAIVIETNNMAGTLCVFGFCALA